MEEVQQHPRQHSLLFRFSEHVVFDVVLVVQGVLASEGWLRVPSAIELEELLPLAELVHILLALPLRQLQDAPDFIDAECFVLVHPLRPVRDVLEWVVDSQQVARLSRFAAVLISKDGHLHVDSDLLQLEEQLTHDKFCFFALVGDEHAAATILPHQGVDDFGKSLNFLVEAAQVNLF